ncbi:hypothetical protein H0H81_003299 [Sphagnurus paluster]|uniref:Uncharacterized protein n=1 Tax=Sphagnurus paluster TaxID=117069 RepID=A0A9P7GLI5_9AGAR|nr:hypothetical protein H0H81_003299 [Sphagnurus paluster]
MSFDEAYINGTFFRPMHHFRTDPATGQLKKFEYDGGKWTNTHLMELIWTSKDVSCYLGTYEMSLAKVLSAVEFSELPQKEGTIKPDNKALKVKITPSRPDSIFDVNNPGRGFEIYPAQEITRKGRLTRTVVWKKPREIILAISANEKMWRCCHLGTFKAGAQRAFTASEFVNLPTDIKQAVYMSTIQHKDTVPDELVIAGVKEKYASGEYTAMRVDFKRIGLNVGVQRHLESVAAGRV